MLATAFTLWTSAKGWRTLAVSLILAVVGVLQTADWATIVGPSAVGPMMLVISAIVAVLRVFTTTAVGSR
jgi:hypothetical protein